MRHTNLRQSWAEAGGGSFIATCFVSAQAPSAATTASATIGRTAVPDLAHLAPLAALERLQDRQYLRFELLHDLAILLDPPGGAAWPTASQCFSARCAKP